MHKRKTAVYKKRNIQKGNCSGKFKSLFSVYARSIKIKTLRIKELCYQSKMATHIIGENIFKSCVDKGLTHKYIKNSYNSSTEKLITQFKNGPKN